MNGVNVRTGVRRRKGGKQRRGHHGLDDVIDDNLNLTTTSHCAVNTEMRNL